MIFGVAPLGAELPLEVLLQLMWFQDEDTKLSVDTKRLEPMRVFLGNLSTSRKPKQYSFCFLSRTSQLLGNSCWRSLNKFLDCTSRMWNLLEKVLLFLYSPLNLFICICVFPLQKVQIPASIVSGNMILFKRSFRYSECLPFSVSRWVLLEAGKVQDYGVRSSNLLRI